MVWDLLRDFNSHERWHPAISTSHIEGSDPSNRIGAVRNFRLADGSMLREQLLSLSDRKRSFSYCLLESPIPLMGYVAHVQLKPVTDGNGTLMEWKSTFSPPRHRRDELVQLVTRDIYQAGFAALRKFFPGAPAQAAERSLVRPETVVTRPVSPVAQVAVSSSQATTRAIVIDRHGGPEVMQLRSIALDAPRSDEVRIRHNVIGVNFIDIYCRTGFFNLLTPPGVLGMEGAGVVEAVGSAVSGVSIGDRVAYACPPVGAYSERRNMSPDLLVRLPDEVSDETAAAGLLKGVTASFLLHDIGQVKAGDVVLIHAAAGGVGQLLVQWARYIGATVIATVSNDDKARRVRELGAHHVVNYSVSNFTEAVVDITNGHGADVVFDAVGRDTLAGSISALAIRGHLISFGQASGPIGQWDLDKFASKSITFSRPNYAHYSDTPEKLGVQVGYLFRALREGIIQIDRPTRFSLEDASDAHRHLESRQSTGSTVLIP